MSEQPATEAPAVPPGGRTPGQVALIAAAAILAILVVATLLGQAGVLPESETAAVNAVFLGACGLAAGVIGAGERRKERWPRATVAYRLAMWCFFLAAVHAVKFHVAAGREAEEERIRRASEKFEQLQRLKENGDTGP
ncbi:MAG: hypothetical protein ACHQ5A_14940 [Opitutales bacterium]